MTGVTTLHPFGYCPTTGTESGWGGGSQRHPDLVGNLDLLDHSIRKLGKNDHKDTRRKKWIRKEGGILSFYCTAFVFS
jgi:hypothetical protein